MSGHGGEAALGRSDDDGTVFILCLPIEEKRAQFGRAGTAAGGESPPRSRVRLRMRRNSAPPTGP